MKRLFSFIIALIFILGVSAMPFAAGQTDVKVVKEQKIEEKKITGKKHAKVKKTRKSKKIAKVKKTKKTTIKKID